MKKAKLRKRIVKLQHLLVDARHEGRCSETDKSHALEAAMDVWRLENDRMGQHAKQRLFAAIKMLGGEVKL